MSTKTRFPWSVFAAVLAITVSEHWIAAMTYQLLKKGMLHNGESLPVWFALLVAVLGGLMSSICAAVYWTLHHANPWPQTLAGKSVRYVFLMLALLTALCTAIASEQALALGFGLENHQEWFFGIAVVLLAVATWWYDHKKEEFKSVVSHETVSARSISANPNTNPQP